MKILQNSSIKSEFIYDYLDDTLYKKNNVDIEDFKLINISEDSYGNVFFTARKNNYKFIVRVINFENYFYVEDENGVFDTFDSRHKVSKVKYHRYKDKYLYKKNNQEKVLFEFDIKNAYRFSIDAIDRFDVAEDIKDYEVMYFDIETESSLDVINTPAPIISISYIKSSDKKKVFMTFKNDKEFNECEKNGCTIKVFKTEEDMLNCFIDEYLSCDIITGWNISGFDIIYLYNRLNALKMGGSILSPVYNVYNKIFVDDDRFESKNFKVYGIDVVDMREMVKKLINFSLDKPTNMTLDKVSQFYLKTIHKVKLKKGISELWRDNEIDELAEYNIRDVELLELLNDKLNLFYYYSNIRKILPSLNFSETQYNSIIIDKMILNEYSDFVFPSKQYSEKLEYTGAEVLEPKFGIYKNVGVFDFNALYPNIIRMFNISPDSRVDEKNENTIEIFGVNFDLTKKAILPKLVNNMITQRYKYKELKMQNKSIESEYKKYDSMETAFKAIINSIYGVFALTSFRLYDVRIASSITGFSRNFIKTVSEFVNRKSDEFRVLSGDSVSEDTCIMLFKNSKMEDVEILRMKDLWERYSENSYFLGNKQYIDLDDCYTISFDYDNNRNSINKINRIMRHYTNKDFYTVKCRNGILEVTKDHSLMKNGKEVKPKILNDNKVVLDTLNDFRYKMKNIDFLDVTKIYVKYFDIFEKNKNNNKIYNLKIDDKYFIIDDIKSKKIMKFPRFIKIDSDFANIIGSYISEGSVCNNNRLTKYYSNLRLVSSKLNKKWNDIIYNSAVNIFGEDLIKKFERKDMYYVTGTHFLLACLFAELFGYGSANKKLDSFVFNTNADFIKTICDNYQIGDGFSEWVEDDNRYNVGGKSKLLTSQFYFIFKHILFENPNFTFKFFQKKKCYSFSVRKSRKYSRDSMKTNRIFIDNNFKYVYDLEIDTNHYFVEVLGDVILHNTDSCFVHCKNYDISYEELKLKFIDLEKEINDYMHGYVEKILPDKYKDNSHFLNIECETIFLKIILPNAKKKYIGIVKLFKGNELSREKIYGRNVEIIKRDTPDAIKKILTDVMNAILYIDDTLVLKNKMNEFKKQIYCLNYKDLLISKQINRKFDEYVVIPQHVRAMKYSNEYLNTNFSRDNYKGGMIFVKNINSKLPDTDVIMLDEDLEFPKDLKIDYEKYFDLYVVRKLILLNSDFERLFSKNKSLSEYF